MNARTLALCTALTVLLTAPRARADNTADEADLRFRRGVKFYQDRKYEDALAEFFQSNRLVKNRNVILNIARCYEQLDRYEEAYRYYDDVLTESPAGDDRRAMEEALQRLAPRVALLRVETTPPGAEIFVERKDLGSRGVTPKTLALEPGKTNVIFALNGYRETSRTASIAKGKTAKLQVSLEYIWGRVKVAGSPADAELRVNNVEGEPEALLPATIRVKPGKHILNVSAGGFLSQQLPFEIKGDEQVELAVDLQPVPSPTGNVVVTANHDRALIRVDGRESGFTPAVVAVPTGRHLIEVSMPEMKPWREEVELEANGRVTVNAELRFAGATTTAASKVEASVDDAPASISVITRDEIRAFGYTSLPAALRAVRGLFFSEDRMYPLMGVRGFSPPGDLNSRVLVLFDGHALNDIYAGQAYIGRENNIDLADVERIEVVRGPVSSLYGSAAFFGVINIVPRKALGEKTVEASGSAGTLGLTRARGTLGVHGGEAGEALVTFGGLKAAGDEILSLPAGGPEGGPLLAQNRDGEVALNAIARARWRSLTLLGGMNSRTKDIPTGAWETGAGTKVTDRRGFMEGRFETAGIAGSFSARAYYDATRYRGRFAYLSGELGVDEGSADWLGTELRYRTPTIGGHQLTFGVEYQNQFSIDQTSDLDGARGLDDHRSFQVLSGYLIEEWRVARWLLVNGSARVDNYMGSFGPTVNPRLAVIARPVEGGVTKLMGGRSFRAPSAYERYYHDGFNDAEGRLIYATTINNEKLDAEKILTAELEHSQELGDFRITGALYLNEITDLVSNVAVETTQEDGTVASLFTFDNASGTVRTQGAEVELRWQPARYSMVAAAYWYQWMTLKDIPDDAEANRLRANAPAHAFSLRGMAPLSPPYLVGSSEVIYNSGRRLRDSGTRTGELLMLNVGLSGELPTQGLRYFAGVQNLLDDRFLLPAGFEVPSLTLPSYGRTFLLQLAASY